MSSAQLAGSSTNNLGRKVIALFPTRSARTSKVNTCQRSHAEITRSESRSSSIEPSNKRRRVHRTPVPSVTPQPAPPAVHYERDGLDFRRPVMSHTAPIDLTGDDDDDDSLSETLGLNDGYHLYEYSQEQPRRVSTPNDGGRTAPPPAQTSRNPPQVFIDLSNDEDQPANPPQELQQLMGPRRTSNSSDIVFVGARVSTPPPVNPSSDNRHPFVRTRLPTPGPHRDRRQPRNMAAPPPLPGRGGGLPNFIRRTTQTIFGALNQPFHPNQHAIALPAPLNDDLEIIDLNYGQAAFPMQDRGSETPQPTPGEAYKEPPPIPEGFAGDIEEDGVYVCPLCDEELATGNTEEKQQVWVVKQCGHVSMILQRYACIH